MCTDGVVVVLCYVVFFTSLTDRAQTIPISDGSPLALYQTRSIARPSSIFYWRVLWVLVPFFLSFLFCFCVHALVGTL